VAIALVLCALAWLRFGWALVANPPAARYLTFVTDAGEVPAPALYWWGPSFARGDVVWRAASYNTQGTWTDVPDARRQIGLVRVDFRRARAEMLWRLPGEGQTGAAVFAFVAHPSGDAAVLTYLPQSTGVGAYRLSARGGVRSLGPPLAMNPSQVLGVAWVGEQLQVVARISRSGQSPSVFTSGTTEWIRVDLDASDGTEVDRCQPILAFREGGAWVTVSARAIDNPWREGVASTYQQRAAVSLTRRSGAGAEQPLGTLSLTFGEYLSGFLSRAPGNLAHNVLGEVYELAEGSVRRVAPPAGVVAHWAARSQDDSLYRVSAEGLEWLPSWRSSERVFRTPSGFFYARNAGGLELRRERAGSGPIALATRWPETWSGFLAVPAEGGGSWLMDEFAGFARVDVALRRADAPGPFARLGLLTERFSRFRRYDGFERASKLLALPLGLLIAPLALGIAWLLARRRRAAGDARTVPFARIALVCIVATLAVGPWFWWLTALL